MKKIFIFIVFAVLFFASCGTLIQSIKNAINGVDIPDINISNDVVNNVANNLKDNFKNTAQNVAFDKLDQSVRKVLEATRKQIDESYNITDFHYAISFGDNSTLYESPENLKNLSSYSYHLLDPSVPEKIKARNYTTAGEVFFVTNSFESAEKAYLEAFRIYESINYLDSTEAIFTMCNLGLLYQTMGMYSASEKYLIMAYNHHQKNVDDTTGYAATLNNLGVLYKTNGNYTESEIYLKKAADYIKKNIGENNIQYSIVLNNIAMLYINLNKIEDAEKYMLQSIDIAKNNTKEKSTTFVRLKVNLALVYTAKKDYTNAEKIYLEALDLLKTKLGKSHPDYATLERGLASLYMQMEKYSSVEPLLLDDLNVYKEKFGEQNPQYANTNYELGVYYQTTGDYSKSETCLTKALETQKITLAEHHPAIAKSYEYLAINYWHKNMPSEALTNYTTALDEYIYLINNYFESMSDAEKTRFWNEYQISFIRFYNFAAQNYKTFPKVATYAYNYHIQTKALLLNSSRKVRSRIMNSNNVVLIQKYQELNDMKNYIAKLYSFSNQELADRKINLDSLIDVSERLEKEVVNMSGDFKLASEQKNITQYEIKSKLAADEVAVEIIRLNKFDYVSQKSEVFYVALILNSANANPDMVIIDEGSKLENEYIKEYQEAIMTGKNMSNFYKYYWADIDKKIASYKKIYLSVDGIYNRINVNTFKLPDSTYIIDRNVIYNLTNTKDVISLKQHLGTKQSLTYKTATLIGFPNYSLGMPQGYSVIPPLPGTKSEIQFIVDALKGNNWTVTTYLNDQATESKLKEIKNPYVLHIATHGYFLEGSTNATGDSRSFGVQNERAVDNPLLRSGLLLAGADKTILNINDRDNVEIDDGVLNAYEAMVMELDKTQLVVLSACQTGLGEIKTGEGVYGLQRAFQIAGTRSIITSLWPVSDEGTQELMTQFYKNWLLSGDEYDAFRKASLYIKDKFKYPYFWGAFVLVGK